MSLRPSVPSIFRTMKIMVFNETINEKFFSFFFLFCFVEKSARGKYGIDLVGCGIKMDFNYWFVFCFVFWFFPLSVHQTESLIAVENNGKKILSGVAGPEELFFCLNSKYLILIHV